MVGIWYDIFEEIKIREGVYDQGMMCSYLLCKGIANGDVRFCFMAGNQVLRLVYREGKLSPHACGPYTFVHCGATCTTTELHNEITGKSEEVSAAHLHPMLPERALRMKRYPLP